MGLSRSMIILPTEKKIYLSVVIKQHMIPCKNTRKDTNLILDTLETHVKENRTEVNEKFRKMY